MDLFQYKKGLLFAENVDVDTIAQQVGTPVYVYSKATILDHFKDSGRICSAGYPDLLLGQGVREYSYPAAAGRRRAVVLILSAAGSCIA